MARINGLLFDGNSVSKQSAYLETEDDGTTRISTAPSKRFQFSNIVISNRAGNSTRFLTLPNGWLFESDQNDDIDALINHFGSKDPLSKKSEPWLTRLAVLGIALLIAWGIIHFGVPGLAKKVAFAVPTETLVNMGKSSLKKMDKDHFQKTTVPSLRQKSIQKVFNKLLPEDKKGFSYKLHFRNAPEIGANAFALPSGDIIITDELVKLTEQDEELQGVLLHEIGHVELRHGIQSTAQTSILALVVIAISGDINSASTLLAAIPALLLNAGYTRNMEWDADGYALDKIKQQQLDPSLFADMMEKITNSSKTTHSKYWSTHPHSVKRIERIRAMASEAKEASI
jgi:Zn-dependent protease with chaperone function